MTATSRDILEWLMDAPRMGVNIRWVVIARDTFSNDNYPVYFSDAHHLWDWIDNLPSTISIDECYDLEVVIEAQMNEDRAWHMPVRPEAAVNGAH